MLTSKKDLEGHIIYLRHKNVSFIKEKKPETLHKVKRNMQIMGCLCFFSFGWCLFDKLDHINFVI